MGARLTIATRRSRLALWQAEHVKARLESRHPGTAVELLALSTRGDELLEERLDKVGGKGLFVKELEQAMIEGRDLPDNYQAQVSTTYLTLAYAGLAMGVRNGPDTGLPVSAWRAARDSPGHLALNPVDSAGDADGNLQLQRGKLRLRLRVFQADRGSHRDAFGFGAQMNRRLAFLLAASRRSGRLGVDAGDLMPGCQQGIEGRNGKVRSSHEGNTHIIHSIPGVSATKMPLSRRERRIYDCCRFSFFIFRRIMFRLSGVR